MTSPSRMDPEVANHIREVELASDRLEDYINKHYESIDELSYKAGKQLVQFVDNALAKPFELNVRDEATRSRSIK